MNTARRKSPVLKKKSPALPRLVGRPVLRVDAEAKLAGQTQYLNDQVRKGTLSGVVVRSPVPHGVLESITLDPAFDWRGVTVATAEDIPGENVVHMHDRSMPLMAAIGAAVHYRGEPIAIVAAATHEKALAAAAAVQVNIKERPALLGLEDAVRIFKKSPKKLETLSAQNIEKGSLAKGFKQADHIIEREYRAGHQAQLYLETQAIVASPMKGGGVLMEGSIQCPFFPANELNDALLLPPEKIRVRQTAMGGAFGGKEDYPTMLGGYAALAALKADKPVKITYERQEDMCFTPKRHPVWVRYKAGYKKDGTLTAIECDYILDGGAYMTISDVVMYRGILHCAIGYPCENVVIRGMVARTNSMPCGAFRGFGAPQAIWGMESLVDEIAASIGMPPDEYRVKFHSRPGDLTPTGQQLTDENGASAVLEQALRRSGYRQKVKKASRGTLRRGQEKYYGIGISFFAHGSAFTGDGEAKFKAKGCVELGRLPDGKPGAIIRVSSTEMGQGVHTIFSQIAAEALRIPMARVFYPFADTGLVPNSGPTVASRTTMVVGNVVHRAALDLRDKLETFASQKFLGNARTRLKDGAFHVKGRRKPLAFEQVAEAALASQEDFTGTFQFKLPDTIQWDQTTFKGDSYPGYSWSANVAEVEIDPLTYEIRVTKVTDVIDIGRVINPMTAAGQVEGGLTQALGYAVMEKMKTGKNGLYDANRLQTYIIPTALDAPAFDVSFVEYPYSFAPPGAKGLGELPMDGLAPAIANAIESALAIRLRELPMTPESIHAALHPRLS